MKGTVLVGSLDRAAAAFSAAAFAVWKLPGSISRYGKIFLLFNSIANRSHQRWLTDKTKLNAFDALVLLESKLFANRWNTDPTRADNSAAYTRVCSAVVSFMSCLNRFRSAPYFSSLIAIVVSMLYRESFATSARNTIYSYTSCGKFTMS